MDLDHIGKYEIISTIGRGSMGLVYKAQDPEIGRLVAIKTLRLDPYGFQHSDFDTLERFKMEARSAGKLRHQNIVTIFETGKTKDGMQFIVMDYIEGENLELILRRLERIEPVTVIHYLAQLASAIDYAHSQNVYHRDIKPGNVIIDSNDCVHLLDFGVAKLSDTPLTPVGTIVGTPSYMSPEQIKGMDCGAGTDIFALGVMSFEMFTGSRPFVGKNFSSVVTNIISGNMLSFNQLGSALPKQLELIFSKALCKEKSERFSCAHDFLTKVAHIFGISTTTNGVIDWNGSRSLHHQAGSLANMSKVGNTNPISVLKQEEKLIVDNVKANSIESGIEEQCIKPVYSDDYLDITERQSGVAIITRNNMKITDYVTESNVCPLSSENQDLHSKDSRNIENENSGFLNIKAIKQNKGVWFNFVDKVIDWLDHILRVDNSRLINTVSVFGLLFLILTMGHLCTQWPKQKKHNIDIISHPQATNSESYSGLSDSSLLQNLTPENNPAIIPSTMSESDYLVLLSSSKLSDTQLSESLSYIEKNPTKELIKALCKFGSLSSSFGNKRQILSLLKTLVDSGETVAIVGLEILLQDYDALIRAKSAQILALFSKKEHKEAIEILTNRRKEESDLLVIHMIDNGLN